MGQTTTTFSLLNQIFVSEESFLGKLFVVSKKNPILRRKIIFFFINTFQLCTIYMLPQKEKKKNIFSTNKKNTKRKAKLKAFLTITPIFHEEFRLL